MTQHLGYQPPTLGTGSLSSRAGPTIDDETFRSLLVQYLLRDRAMPAGGGALARAWPSLTAPELGEPASAGLWPSLDPVDPLTDSYRFHLLTNWRSDVASLARFSQRIDFATFHLCTARGSMRTPRFWQRRGARLNKAASCWYSYLVDNTFERYQVLRGALRLDWALAPDVAPLYEIAFVSLSELTPADSQLRLLFSQDRPRAFAELTRHLDIVAEQLEVTAKLAEDLAPAADASNDGEASRRAAIEADLLAKAGEALSLTQAAKRLGTTRQNLHKRISTGSAIGVMRGAEFIVPSAQFTEGAKGLQIVPHLRDVLAPFRSAEAGPWTALQFLVEPDPALGQPPLEALRAGDVKAAVAAARAFLGLDEE